MRRARGGGVRAARVARGGSIVVGTRVAVLGLLRCRSSWLSGVRGRANVGDVSCSSASKALLLRVRKVGLFVRVVSAIVVEVVGASWGLVVVLTMVLAVIFEINAAWSWGIGALVVVESRWALRTVILLSIT